MSHVAFWVTVCKTVRHMLSDSYLSCLSVCPDLSVCNVGVLWPNGWMDQDVTWCGRRPRPRPHCVRWRPSSPLLKSGTVAHFSAHIYCGQTAGWTEMPLGTHVGLGPGDIVLDWDPTPPKKEHSTPHFSAHVCFGQTAEWIKMPLRT